METSINMDWKAYKKIGNRIEVYHSQRMRLQTFHLHISLQNKQTEKKGNFD
jgi:hypothetical protein